MPFVKINKSSRGGLMASVHPIVTMGAYLADGKQHKNRSVTFRLTSALLTELGWEFNERSILVGVFEGTGTDKGFIQLAPDPKGYKCSRPVNDAGIVSNQGISVNVSVERFKHYVLNECPVSSAPVQYIIEGTSLIVECPDWLRYNPLSEPQEEKKEEPQRPPPREEPARREVVNLRGRRRG